MRRTLTRYLIRLVPIDTPDGAGGSTRQWERRGAFWGEVAARSGRVRSMELGAIPDLRLRITVRSVPFDHPNRPVPGDRFREGDRLYAIDAVHEADHKGRYLACFARETFDGARP